MVRSPQSSPVVERVSTERRRSRAPLLLAALAGTTAFLGAASVATLCRYPELWREARSTAVFRVQSRSMEPAFRGPRFVWRCPECEGAFATTLDVDSSGGVRSFDDVGETSLEKKAGGGSASSNLDSPEVRKFRATARFFPCPRCGFDRVPASTAVFLDGVLVEGVAATAPRSESANGAEPANVAEKTTRLSAKARVKKVWDDWRRRLERLENGGRTAPRPERWDVVVFRAPTGRATLKRVVGLPGETVEIVAGDVFVDGRVAPRTLEQIVSTATRLDSAQIRRTDDRLTVVATTPIWNVPTNFERSESANAFPQTDFAPTPISNESPTPRWNGDDPAPVEPVRDFLLDFSWSNGDGAPTRFRLLARRPKRAFLLDFDDAETTISLRSLPLVDGRTSAGRTFDELTAADFAESPIENVRRPDAFDDGAGISASKSILNVDERTLCRSGEAAADATGSARSTDKNASRFRVFLVDGELILTRNGGELARFSTGDVDDPTTAAISAPFALLGDVARAFAPILRRDLHYSSVAPSSPIACSAEPPRCFLLGDNSPASLDSRFETFGTIDSDAILFRVAPTVPFDGF